MTTLDCTLCRHLAGCESTPADIARQLTAAVALEKRHAELETNHAGALEDLGHVRQVLTSVRDVLVEGGCFGHELLVDAAKRVRAERDAAWAECDRLRQECNDAADRDAEPYRLREVIARLRSLLAIEPAVSEVGVSEIEQEFRPESEDDAADVRYLIAGYRQLHALRAELAQIVGSGSPAAHDKAGSIAWSATGSRVTALTWIAERLAGAAMDPGRDREAAQVIADMFSEVSP